MQPLSFPGNSRLTLFSPYIKAVGSLPMATSAGETLVLSSCAEPPLRRKASFLPEADQNPMEMWTCRKIKQTFRSCRDFCNLLNVFPSFVLRYPRILLCGFFPFHQWNNCDFYVILRYISTDEADILHSNGIHVDVEYVPLLLRGKGQCFCADSILYSAS